MKLDEALLEISHIRAQVARTETFRGYRSLTVALSGGIALVAAAVQGFFVAQPLEMVDRYLAVWTSAAACSMAAAAVGMMVHLRRSSSPLTREHTRSAVEQFLPCIAAGAVITLVIARQSLEAAWMLPGLWSLLFSLGIFSSISLLPRRVALVAIYYFLCGTLLLVFPRGAEALEPWTMGLVFGVGQLSAAAVLYFSLERSDECET